MRFGLTEDQAVLRDAVRDLLARHCPPAVVRSAWHGDLSTVDTIWARLAGMGVPGAAVPEPDGGLGLTETDLVPLLIEVGYAAVPAPVAETALVVAPLLAAAGTGDRGPIAGGPSTGGPSTGRAITGGPITRGPITGGPITGGPITGGPSTGGAAGTGNRAGTPAGNRAGMPAGSRTGPRAGTLADILAGVVAGSVRVSLAGPGGIVPYGQCADLVLVLPDCAGEAILARPGPKLSTVDGSRLATGIGATEAVVPAGAGQLARAADRASLGTAAQLVGLSRRMLELTVGYVGGRRQFGVPVGSFQAVKHKLADALLRLEFAEPAVLAAGWALAGGDPDAPRDVAAALLLAEAAAREVAGTAIQCHGAMGYTVEYDLHLYAKRAWALAAGVDVDAHLRRIGAAIGIGDSGARDG